MKSEIDIVKINKSWYTKKENHTRIRKDVLL
jgi:hypothetical protein